MRSRKERIHDKIDQGYTTDRIADMFGIDEDDVIAAIHDNPILPDSPHDIIDAWLKSEEFAHAGQPLTGKWADKFIETPSPYSDSEFFQIRNRDPQRRKYFISDDAIVVRICIDGDFYDSEYRNDPEIAELIESQSLEAK